MAAIQFRVFDIMGDGRGDIIQDRIKLCRRCKRIVEGHDDISCFCQYFLMKRREVVSFPVQQPAPVEVEDTGFGGDAAVRTDGGVFQVKCTVYFNDFFLLHCSGLLLMPVL